MARENAWYLRPANQRAASKHTASAHRPAAQLCVSAQGRAWHLSPANTSHTFTCDPLALALMMHAMLLVMRRCWPCSPAWTLQEYDICPRLLLGPELLQLHHSQGVQAQGLGAGRMADMCPGRGSFWSLVSVHTGDQVQPRPRTHMRSPSEEPHLASGFVTFSLFLVTSDISPELISCANGLLICLCQSFGK